MRIQAVEACALFNVRLGVEWMRWHGAAVLRIGSTFPLDSLARVRDAYASLQAAPESRMQQLLDTLPWRLQRQQRRATAQQRAAERRAALTSKNRQRQLQNERDRTAKAGGGSGQQSEGRQQWRKRKLRLPGTLERKF